jgi:hypothetical protein
VVFRAQVEEPLIRNFTSRIAHPEDFAGAAERDRR